MPVLCIIPSFWSLWMCCWNTSGQNCTFQACLIFLFLCVFPFKGFAATKRDGEKSTSFAGPMFRRKWRKVELDGLFLKKRLCASILAKIIGVHDCASAGIKHRASWMLGRHSLNLSASPVTSTLYVQLEIYLICTCQCECVCVSTLCLHVQVRRRYQIPQHWSCRCFQDVWYVIWVLGSELWPSWLPSKCS